MDKLKVLWLVCLVSLCFAFSAKAAEDGLVACWDFDEGDGLVLQDRSGNENNGNIYGANWVKGKKGSCLQFDGEDDTVNCGKDASLDLWQNFTIEGWFKVPRGETRRFIYSRYSGYKGPQIEVSSNGCLNFYFGGTQEKKKGYSSGSKFKVDDDRWHYFAGVHDDVTKTGKLYIDGILANSIGSTNLSSTSETAYIGSFRNAKFFFPGLIDEIRIYERSLTADEIWGHYEGSELVSKKASLEDADSDLVLYFDFDEGAGLVLLDKSGNKNHGRMVGGVSRVKGVSNSALSFDGKNGYVTVSGESLNLGTSDFTVGFWVKLSNLVGMLANKRGDGNHNGWSVSIGKEGNISFGIQQPNRGGVGVTSNTCLLPEKFYQITVVRRAESMEIYINGVLDNSKPAVKAYDVSCPNPLLIGTWPSWLPVAWMEGTVDELKIYKRALTADEIKNHLFLLRPSKRH